MSITVPPICHQNQSLQRNLEGQIQSCAVMDPTTHSYYFKDKLVSLTKPVTEKYVCRYCGQLMFNPIQNSEGFLSCKSCFPSDECNNRDRPFEDKMIKREINKLEAACLYRDCKWVGALGDIDMHEQKYCKFSKTQCEYCQEKVFNHSYKEHCESECRGVMKKCLNCGKSILADELEHHKMHCSMPCPFDCKKRITKDNIKEHLGICDEFTSGKICPYKIIDCEFQLKSPDDCKMKAHLAEHASNPTLFIDAIFKLKFQNNEMQKRLEANECGNAEDRIRDIEDQLKQHLEQVKMAKEKLQRKHVEFRNKEQRLEEMLKKYEQLNDNFNKQIKKVSEFTENLCAANFPTETGTFDKSHLRKLTDSNNSLVSLEKEVALVNSHLADAEMNIQLLQNSSTNGKLVWRITNFMYRLQQAELQEITALHSAPCTTGQNEYKFCVRVYPNGDGMGKNTHLSIYFVLMKGLYDELLDFPFYRRVTFRILNHRDIANSKKEVFITDRNSSSFQRPKRDMNIAAGCPKFISKDALLNSGYLIDDSIFVETRVEKV